MRGQQSMNLQLFADRLLICNQHLGYAHQPYLLFLPVSDLMIFQVVFILVLESKIILT
jgi:hypothetical protein